MRFGELVRARRGGTRKQRHYIMFHSEGSGAPGSAVSSLLWKLFATLCVHKHLFVLNIVDVQSSHCRAAAFSLCRMLPI